MRNRQFQQWAAALDMLKMDAMHGFHSFVTDHQSPERSKRHQRIQFWKLFIGFSLLLFFLLWQVQHNDSRLKSSSVPP
ncbi:hypothetical protein LNP17_11890 [Klebsiella variicola subsp. variicola]|nr:hypothetical protein [Klebsiella variicola subsp. variicola]